uniref:Uncharacterized protein n=1 Tax=Rhizophora mucronata TaxID=61149 RepID=A0A2P2Q275_RHIMU
MCPTELQLYQVIHQ